MRGALAVALLLCAACGDYPTSDSANTYAPGSSGAPSPPVIATSSLPVGTVGQPYTAYLLVNGGVNPFAYTITTGSLPPGLSLGLQSGAIAGTPTDTGSFNVTFRVATGNGTNDRALTLTVQ